MLSNIKSIKITSPYLSSSWTEEELRFLSFTNGNVGFRDFMTPYNLDFAGLRKYMTRAAIFYLSDTQRKLKGVSGIEYEFDLLGIEEGQQIVFQEDTAFEKFSDSETKVESNLSLLGKNDFNNKKKQIKVSIWQEQEEKKEQYFEKEDEEEVKVQEDFDFEMEIQQDVINDEELNEVKTSDGVNFNRGTLGGFGGGQTTSSKISISLETLHQLDSQNELEKESTMATLTTSDSKQPIEKKSTTFFDNFSQDTMRQTLFQVGQYTNRQTLQEAAKSVSVFGKTLFSKFSKNEQQFSQQQQQQ